MKRLAFVVFFVLAISIILAEGLEVRSFEEDNFDMHGSVSPMRDANGDNCALIRVEHNLAGEVHLTDVEVYKREKKTANIIYFYISKWEQAITISTEKYLPIKYRFSTALEPEKTYVLTLFGSGEGDDIEDIPVTITTEPSGATVYIDNIRLSGVTPASDFFIAGTYSIRIELDEYATLKSEIVIMPPSVDKDYALEPDFGKLEIISIPEVNMAVFLNDEPIGKTPITLERCKANSYTLRAEHTYYSCDDEEFEIRRRDTKEIVITAIPEFGNLEIVSDPEKNLNVYINEEAKGKTPLKLDKFALGKYAIRAENEYYTTESKEFNLESGEYRKITLTAVPEFGNLEIVSEPEKNLNVYINNREVGITPLKLDKFALGEYEIRAENEYYTTESKEFNLESGDYRKITLTAIPKFGNLEIVSDPEKNLNVYINNREMGITPLKLDKFALGEYEIRAENEYYTTKSEKLNVDSGDYRKITLTAIPKFGNLEIVTDPEKNLNVYINNREMGKTPLILEKFAPGEYEIRAENKYYTTESEKLNLKSGEYRKITLTAVAEYGRLEIVSVPEVNFAVFINEKNVGKTPITLDRQLKGEYLIRGNHELYKTPERKVKLKSDTIERIVLEAEQNFGTLNIKTSTGASVYLNTQLLVELIGLKLSPQTLNLRAELAKHRSVEKKDIVKSGDVLEIELYPEPLTGTILVNPEPGDAKIILIGDREEYFENIGICRFSDIPIGKYKLEVSHPQYLPYEETIDLAENDRKKIEANLVKAELRFSVDIPEELRGELEIELYDDKMQQVNLYKINEDYLVDKAGFYSLSILKGKNKIYQKAIQITSSNKPEIKPYFRRYETPSMGSRLYLNKKLTDGGKHLVLASDDKINNVKIMIPGYAGFCREDTLKKNYSAQTLELGKDYYKRLYGIGLIDDRNAIFYGIKFTYLYPPMYKDFYGIAIGFGNIEFPDVSGYFGIALGGLGLQEYNFNGIAIGGGFAFADNNFNGIAIGGLIVGCNNVFNGIAISGLGAGAGNNFKGISIGTINLTLKRHTGIQIGFYNQAGSLKGVQLGAINYTESLQGIQIGALNVVKDGSGGALPFFPIINVHF